VGSFRVRGGSILWTASNAIKLGVADNQRTTSKAILRRQFLHNWENFQKKDKPRWPRHPRRSCFLSLGVRPEESGWEKNFFLAIKLMDATSPKFGTVPKNGVVEDLVK
jgi:hypothetical protein